MSFREAVKKKLPNFGHCPNFLNLPPIRGGLDSKSLEIMKLSWPPHPLGKFGHLGNKCLAFKKAFILLRLKTVCLYRQVELLVYTSTLHFRPSCDNVTMNHFFERHSLNLFWGVLNPFLKVSLISLFFMLSNYICRKPSEKKDQGFLLFVPFLSSF